MRIDLRQVTLAVVLVFAACGAEPTEKSTGPDIVIDSDAGTQPDEGFVTTPGEVTISATVAEHSRIGSTPLESGNYLALTAVTIANGLEEALPVGYPLFRLRAGALEHLPSPASEEIDLACPTDSLLAADTQLDCTVVFEVPKGEEPTALIFQNPTGTVETSVSFQPCTRCDGGCVDLQTNEAHCGACNTAVPDGGECVDGAPGCSAGEYSCDGDCQRNSSECFLSTTRQISCAAHCATQDLQCKEVAYYYDCGDNTSDTNTALGCDDQPPRTWDECGTYTDMDCRCLPG